MSLWQSRGATRPTSLFQQHDDACLTLIQRAWGAGERPPPTDLKAWKSPTLTIQRLHLTAVICTHSCCCCCCCCFPVKRTSSTFWVSEGREGQESTTWVPKRENERRRNYTAMHSGKEPSCQACLGARTRPRFTTDLPPKLLMSNISCFPSLTPHLYLSLFISPSLSLLPHMLALPDSQPPLQISFHSLYSVVMVTNILVLQSLSPVTAALIWYFCNLKFPHGVACRGRCTHGGGRKL